MKPSVLVLFLGLCLPLLAGIQVSNTEVTTVYATKSNMACAQDFASFLARVFNHEYSVIESTTVSGAGFYVGKEFAKDLPEDTHPEAFFVVVKGDKVFLYGNSDKQYNGNWRAANAFLERFCGVRWLFPGAAGEVVPRCEELKLSDTTIIEKPAFQVRVLKYGVDRQWAQRMNLGQSIDYTTGHAFSKWLPPTKYFKEHPEYYGLVSATNRVGGESKSGKAERCPAQLCTSNPEVRRLIAEQVAAKKTGMMQSISPNDGYGFCECENCRKLDPERWTSIHTWPNLSNRMYDFAKDVALQAKKLYPESKVLLNIYTFCRPLPDLKVVGPMPDNLYLLDCLFGSMVKDRKEIEDKFATYNKMGVNYWIYEYWGCYTHGAWSVIDTIDWELKLMKKTNAIGIRVENGTGFACVGLDNYIGARLIWNPDLNADALIDDYCEKGFGAAKTYMKEYFALLNRLSANMSQNASGFAAMIYLMPDFYTADFFTQAAALFDKALKCKISPEERARVQFFHTGFRYTAINTEWSRTLQNALAAGADLPLLRPAKQPERYTDEWLRETLKNAFNAAENRRSMQEAQMNLGTIDTSNRLERLIDKMPYYILLQQNLYALNKGRFNYAINGAFEYRSYDENAPLYGWKSEGGKHSIDLEYCHDSIHNVTAMYHGNQGRSYKLELADGEKSILAAAVPLQVSAGSKWTVSGYFRNPQNVDVKAQFVFFCDGEETIVEAQLAAKGLLEDSGWQEWTFTPAIAPQGENVSCRVRLAFANMGKASVVLNADDIKLMKAK